MYLSRYIEKERKNMFNKVLKQLSKLGKAMLIPIAATPVAGLLARLSAADMLNMPVLETAGWVVFGMMDVLFAIGAVIAYAKAKDRSIPIIGAIISLSVFKAVLVYMNEAVNMGVFAGILVGVMTAIVFNYSKEWKTPAMFSFFTGEKFVVTLAPLVAIPLAILFSFLWVPCQAGLNNFGIWIAGAGALGVFVFGLTNRLLIPIGLHHVVNTYIYYELGSFTTASGEIVKGEIPRFLAGDPTAGLFLAMFFIPMMFGLPGACLAMYKTAKEKNKEKTKSLMSSASLTTFVAGITEPIEFSFMFVAPRLYAFHALLTGTAGAILYLLNVHFGMSVNFCVIDYILNFKLSTNGWMIVPIGIVFFFIYYFGFKIMIEKWDLKTPGREEELKFDENEISTEEINIKLEHTNYQYMAKKILQNIGGKDNVEEVENCVTRLRLELKDGSLVNEENIKKTGAKGVVRFGETSIQIIIGTEVNKVAREFKEMLEN
ncbi:PTS transporter subunit EIIC [Clostridioides sp. ES-S-0056-01]|uniref:PTS transporter subunit EIIC n=1 Tax=Clostridioides sp. ES-S-0056-01 TaxID=2770781 RepID=UPI001D100719